MVPRVFAATLKMQTKTAASGNVKLQLFIKHATLFWTWTYGTFIYFIISYKCRTLIHLFSGGFYSIHGWESWGTYTSYFKVIKCIVNCILLPESTRSIKVIHPGNGWKGRSRPKPSNSIKWGNKSTNLFSCTLSKEGCILKLLGYNWCVEKEPQTMAGR